MASHIQSSHIYPNFPYSLTLFVCLACGLNAAAPNPALTQEKPAAEAIQLRLLPDANFREELRASSIAIGFKPRDCKFSFSIVSNTEQLQQIEISPALNARMAETTDKYLDRLDAICQLSPSQREKLQLAAAYEQQCTLRRVKIWLQRYHGADWGKMGAASREISQLYAEMHACPHGSTFSQILERTLSHAQRTHWCHEHLIWFSQAAQRGAVLSDQERGHLLEHLLLAADGRPLKLDRSEFIKSVLQGVELEQLEEFLDKPRALALQRLVNYHLNQP